MMIVEAKQLARRFGQRWAYARIDLCLNSGEKLLLFGANGSGKTTLLQSLATLLAPTRGELNLFGEPIGNDLSKTRKQIGLISHQVGLYEDLSALENLQVFAQLYGGNLSKNDGLDILESVGLEYRKEPISQYSAGMRKRASIALVLLKDPKLILLDEPFSALDPEGVDALSKFIESSSATMVITSHQVERAASLCSRAVMLQNGIIRWEGDASQAWEAWVASQREQR